MEKCMSCGKNALFTIDFGRTILCRNCAAAVNVSAWKNRDFESTDDLTRKKNDAISRALANCIAPNIVTEITGYFDEYTDNGFEKTIDGKAGQTLKVFKDYCIITTKNERKSDDLKREFYQFEDKDVDDNDELLSPDNKKRLMKGLMSGRLIKTGIDVAVSATINKQEKEKTAKLRAQEREKRIDQLITVGERRVTWCVFDSVKILTKSGCNYGCLRFSKKGTDIIYNSEYFIFNNSIPFESKRIRREVEAIQRTINKRIQDYQGAEVARTATNHSSKTEDVFSEIRKYKGLLDDGIITQDEFITKKKQLLGL